MRSEIAYGGARVRAGRHALGHLGRGLGLPAARHGSTRPPAASRRSSPTSNWDVDELRHRRGRPLHRLRHQRGGDRAGCGCSTRAPAARGWSTAFPAGMIGGLEIAPWGAIGFSLHLGAQPDRRLFGRSANARGHPLDAQRDRRARYRAQRRARAGRGAQLRRRARLGLPLPARSRRASRAAGR